MDLVGILDRLLSHVWTDGTVESLATQLARVPTDLADKRRLLQALLTVRGPDPLSDWFHNAVDRLLQHEMFQRQITPAGRLPRVSASFPGSSYSGAELCALWQGDITTLAVDAIVKAANAQLLGCFQPFHRCIDNVIHTAAGPRLRDDCATIMGIQGYPEGTSWAKITRGYNLPARFVLHTVGPIVPRGRAWVTEQQAEQLADSYRACLDLAGRFPDVRSVAFCCISTGVFGYPQEAVAQIALDMVAAWLAEHASSIELVQFNVFNNRDLEIYEARLSV
jgi:O-acetyl-ADP-ribose deacetylase (regulator of RNase III)